MDDTIFSHLKGMWPFAAVGGGFILALIITIQYKMPDLAARVLKIEKKGANNQDLERITKDFQTVCRFNQVSCQKEMEYRWSALNKDHDKKLSELYEKLNELMVENGKLVAKVEILINDRGINQQ